MSKVIKQMQMDVLRNTFQEIRDMVVLSISGLGSIADNQLRATLARKNIRLQVIKNSLTRRVFNDLNMVIGEDSPVWKGPTTVAWGTSSIAELSQTIEAELKGAKTASLYKDKVRVKGAVVDGQVISFEQALKMPTRLEAIGRVVSMMLAPASRLSAQLRGPGARLASQLKSLEEKSKEEGAAAPAAEAPASTPA